MPIAIAMITSNDIVFIPKAIATITSNDIVFNPKAIATITFNDIVFLSKAINIMIPNDMTFNPSAITMIISKDNVSNFNAIAFSTFLDGKMLFWADDISLTPSIQYKTLPFTQFLMLIPILMSKQIHGAVFVDFQCISLQKMRQVDSFSVCFCSNFLQEVSLQLVFILYQI